MGRQPVTTPPPNGELETLLEYLYERRNFDFRGYKRASLTRRIFKRMMMINVEDYQRYVEVLEANPGEFAELFNTILVNVTSLMRDKDDWEALAARVIPVIVGSKASGEPIRIWSAGCASGEEAYSLAVLFATAMGEDRFRRLVKIYATDADTDALATARHGRYRWTDLTAAFGDELSTRFFESDGDFGVSATTCAGRWSSVGTIWYRTPRSPASTWSPAATHSCTSPLMSRARSWLTSTSHLTPEATSSSASQRLW